MHNFRELKVWTRSRQLVVDIYRITSEFPSEEKFGLTSQMRRAAISVPSNVAEGCGRNTKGDLMRFVDISLGSAFELESQLYAAQDLNLVSHERIRKTFDLINEIQRMLYGFRKSLSMDK